MCKRVDFVNKSDNVQPNNNLPKNNQVFFFEIINKS